MENVIKLINISISFVHGVTLSTDLVVRVNNGFFCLLYLLFIVFIFILIVYNFNCLNLNNSNKWNLLDQTDNSFV